MSNIFAFTPGAYKESVAYTVRPNDGTGDFAFSRPAPADRTDPDSAIESMGINVPRVDYAEEGCPLLLLDRSLSEVANNANVITSMDSTVFSSQLKKTLASNASNVIYSNTANDSVTFGFGSGATTVSVIADIKLAGVSQGTIDYPNTDATLLREIKVVKNSDVAEMKVDGVYVGMVDSLPNINSTETVAYDMDGKAGNNTIDDDVASSNSTATSYVELDTQINNFTTR